MRFERRNEPVLPWPAFLWRLAGSTLIGAGLVIVSLAIGMIGYRSFMGMSWIDAFVNASMILSGMGPLADPQTSGAKLFAGLYALLAAWPSWQSRASCSRPWCIGFCTTSMQMRTTSNRRLPAGRNAEQRRRSPAPQPGCEAPRNRSSNPVPFLVRDSPSRFTR